MFRRLVAFTRALGSLSIEYGVRVLGVNPGYVETDIVTRAAENIASKTKLNEEEARASLYAGNPASADAWRDVIARVQRILFEACALKLRLCAAWDHGAKVRRRD